jgi:two-component system, cell cycle sensor histidine kinase and response regulator CckA
MTTRIEKSVRIGSALVLILFLGIGVMVYESTRRLLGINQLVEHTQEVLVKLEVLQSTLDEAVSSTRNYVLVGGKQNLDRFARANVDMTNLLRDLHELDADNPLQQERIRSLRSQLVSTDQYWETAIALRSKGDSAAADHWMSSAVALQFMRDDRLIIFAMIQDKNRLLGASARQAEDSARRSIVIELLLAIAALATVAVAYVFIQMDTNERKRALQALRRSEASLAAAQRIAHLGSWELDLTNREGVSKNALRWSDEVFRIFGHERGRIEVSSEAFLRAVHPDDRGRIRAAQEEALRGGRPYNIEHRIALPDGSERIVHGQSNVIFDPRTQRPLAMVGTIQDITERSQAEAELLRLAAIVECSNDAITGINLEGIITSWNSGAERIYGFSGREAVGSPITIVVAADHHKEPLEILERIKRGEQVADFESNRIRRNGKQIEVSLTISPIRDPNGKLTGVSEIGRDFSARKKMEMALRQSEAKFRSLIENSPYGILQTTPDGKVLQANPALVAMLGYGSEAEVLGLNMGIDVYRNPADRTLVIEQLCGQEYAKNEIDWKRKNGKSITVRTGGHAVRDHDGTVDHYEVFVEDISDLRALEGQFRQAHKMEAVGRFSGGIAHDFNNLLGVIIGYTEILEQGLGSTSTLYKYAKEIDRAATRAASLIRQLLAFSRQQVLEPKVINLNRVLREMKTMLERLMGEDIELTTDLVEGLWHVRADQGQIEQVVMNLVVNARDAMPQGGKLMLETANAELDEAFAAKHPPTISGSYALLTVTDTGTGMDTETQARLFEPFFTTKGKDKGTGLGLAVVYGVIKQSGGYIWVFSEPGTGTTFKIYLPRVRSALGEARINEAPADSLQGFETILLVEDEESLLELTRDLLVHEGYTVLVASNGAQALKIAHEQQGNIHLLLTDVVLPGMRGPEVAAKIAPLRPVMKVLFISGYTDYSVAVNGELEAGTFFLAKPFTRAALLGKVRQVLDAKVLAGA